MAIRGINTKFGFKLVYFVTRDGKDVTFDEDSSGTYEEHVYFFSRYLAKQYAEKRLCLKTDEYLIRKVDSERWTIHFIQELTHDDVLVPDYNDAIKESCS